MSEQASKNSKIDHGKYLPEIKERASRGECDGSCEPHEGEVSVYRVFAKDGYDWGYFAYCEAAITEDVSRDFELEEVK